MSMKPLEALRGARRIELYIAVVALAALALLLLRGAIPGEGADKTELELRLERILGQIDDAGKVSVMVTQNADGAATGAVVVADGLTSIGAYLRLQQAVRALLNIDISQITIIGREEAFGG